MCLMRPPLIEYRIAARKYVLEEYLFTTLLVLSTSGHGSIALSGPLCLVGTLWLILVNELIVNRNDMSVTLRPDHLSVEAPPSQTHFCLWDGHQKHLRWWLICCLDPWVNLMSWAILLTSRECRAWASVLELLKFWIACDLSISVYCIEFSQTEHSSCCSQTEHPDQAWAQLLYIPLPTGETAILTSNSFTCSYTLKTVDI